jgi:hypothetical protein
MHFTGIDLDAMHVDPEGGVFFVDDPLPERSTATIETPATADAAVPLAPFPTSLLFHSRPGAPNVLYLNFTGETITGTAWNNSLGRTEIPAVAFSTDSDFSTFSDAEQQAIKRIWERVSEDYAPFDVDVTTERPETFTIRTAHALITRNTDANGDPNPSSGAGGVAYVNVFANGNYANYQPAWIYFNNLGKNESYIAEAASHEIGHNLGLSHDAKTDGTSYYGGHGSGDISWGPIMGTGYNRNVSQWSKGEYYLANNTQDDLEIIAAKLNHRADDHGDTDLNATPLTLTDGTNVVSSTPETDPENLLAFNKGVLEAGSDVDVFSFTTGNGPIQLSVRPWIMPAGTRGGNLDVLLELYDESGTLLLTNNSATETDASLSTTLSEGLYYLHVRNTGTGDPFAANPSGYTDYASLGQYFISGAVTPSGYNAPPRATLLSSDLTQTGLSSTALTVTYSDNFAVSVATLDDQDLRVTGPNGYDQQARFVSVDNPTDGTPRAASYSLEAPEGGAWSSAHNGTYIVWLQTNQVSDTQGAWALAQRLGEFRVNIPVLVFADSFDQATGWTLDGQWEHGAPAYPDTGPVTGFTGANILGYNLSGNYPDNLDLTYAVSPVIDCTQAGNLTLRFARWLRTRNGDTAIVEVTTNGVSWTTVWSSSSTMSDTSWHPVDYALPAFTANSPTVQLRWGLGSGRSRNDIGWNLDDIELAGVLSAPVAAEFTLNVGVNQPAWGTVSPTNSLYPAGSPVSITATPAPYFQFAHWAGDLIGTNNPGSIIVDTNRSVQAVFEEILTLNHPTPLWWLASCGHTQDWETAVSLVGSNGLPLWQSYVAGLDPNDPDSQLRLSIMPSTTEQALVLQWTSVSNRLYTVEASTNGFNGFHPIPSAVDLPGATAVLTDLPAAAQSCFYRLQVRLP